MRRRACLPALLATSDVRVEARATTSIYIYLYIYIVSYLAYRPRARTGLLDLPPGRRSDDVPSHSLAAWCRGMHSVLTECALLT